jgi:hypothetical protein
VTFRPVRRILFLLGKKVIFEVIFFSIIYNKISSKSTFISIPFVQPNKVLVSRNYDSYYFKDQTGLGKIIALYMNRERLQSDRQFWMKKIEISKEKQLKLLHDEPCITIFSLKIPFQVSVRGSSSKSK